MVAFSKPEGKGHYLEDGHTKINEEWGETLCRLLETEIEFRIEEEMCHTVLMYSYTWQNIKLYWSFVEKTSVKQDPNSKCVEIFRCPFCT